MIQECGGQGLIQGCVQRGVGVISRDWGRGASRGVGRGDYPGVCEGGGDSGVCGGEGGSTGVENFISNISNSAKA